MKIGYKGFSKDMKTISGLKTEDITYQIGEVYTKEPKENPRVCTSDGYHYCDKLENVFDYYPMNGDNRYFEIEVLGNFTDEHNKTKSIATSFKLLRELPKEELENKRLKEKLNLDIVKEIQIKYPMLHVGGSVGLFLHGVRLKRWFNKHKSDIDMVSPYFILPEGEIDEEPITYLDAKASGNDFDETFMIGNDIKVDYRIDNKQRYEIITFDGFDYKVSPLLTILEAKMRYALMKNGHKHKADLIEMVTRVKPVNKVKFVSVDELFK